MGTSGRPPRPACDVVLEQVWACAHVPGTRVSLAPDAGMCVRPLPRKHVFGDAEGIAPTLMPC